MALLPIRGANEPAEQYLDRLMPPLREAIASLTPGPSNTAVDGAGNVYVSPAAPPGVVPKLGRAAKIVKIDTENLVDGAVKLAQTDIPTLVLANRVVAGDAIVLSLLAGDIEAIEARIDNLIVNDANIANLSASKITAGEIAVDLTLYAAEILGGRISITGGTQQLAYFQTSAGTFAGRFEQSGTGGGVSVICNNGSFAGNGLDVQTSGSGKGVAANSSGGYAVHGVSATNDAVRGECGDGTHAGVYGRGGANGVYGIASNVGARGVYGYHNGSSGAGAPGDAGVWGKSDGGYGVVGQGDKAGVYGSVTSGGYAGQFRADSGVALYAQKFGSSGTLAQYYVQNGSYSGSLHALMCDRSGSSAYNFLVCQSNFASGADTEFVVNGAGQVASDGGTTMSSPADYAEYFESLSGDAIPVGTTVVLVGERVRPATADDPPDDIIGVIRPVGTSTVVGAAAWNHWSGKYLRDAYDAPALDGDGARVLSPAFDPDRPYTPREQRPEWVIVGLLGQVAITAGQPVNSRWRKLADASETVERWFIR
ncbi:peptidase G2 autoproteolytic cleavage domain-containing protein [Azospirillum picis]|uniref:Peptidase G2 IMC autoproteolytic cleavage domain-containing protein n=1 Tax=Azospirillum picis TaxID=488438 RepID=A0ABU0MPK1_9PROT|nr:peptidase G2 autoproteolytic cleavage domain-containing protein [Azospirillum picis]MBP2301576.1 hypothetical protein [Azospirillum picis]MDQ0535408.1 hypothetical protein [Azospirillum picis]